MPKTTKKSKAAVQAAVKKPVAADVGGDRVLSLQALTESLGATRVDTVAGNDGAAETLIFHKEIEGAETEVARGTLDELLARRRNAEGRFLLPEEPDIAPPADDESEFEEDVADYDPLVITSFDHLTEALAERGIAVSKVERVYNLTITRSDGEKTEHLTASIQENATDDELTEIYNQAIRGMR